MKRPVLVKNAALWLKATEEAADKPGVRLVPTGVRSSEDFERAFALMKQAEATGFVVLGEPLFFGPKRRRVDLIRQASNGPRVLPRGGGATSMGGAAWLKNEAARTPLMLSAPARCSGGLVAPTQYFSFPTGHSQPGCQ